MDFFKDAGKLGFGLMRLPKRQDESFDTELTEKLVDTFLEAGFNYFDTAWGYPGSEEVTRKVLVERYPRGSYLLASKNPCWLECETKADAEAQLATSLERLGTDYLDNYLLHNLGEHRTAYFDRFDMWNFVQEKKKEGVIGHWGFSFHDKPEVLEEILKNHPKPEFIQLQINYADWNNPDIRSRECYEICVREGIPVIVMEPVRGGMLANPPAAVREIFQAADPEASCSSWGMRFAASLPGVVTVLSGMNSMEQMTDNIRTFRSFTGLSPEEKKTIQKAQDEFAKADLIPCTACNYCAKVCPANVGISGTFSIMNVNSMFGLENAKSRIGWVIKAHHVEMPDACLSCGACEAVCPQHLKIRELLKEAAAVLC